MAVYLAVVSGDLVFCALQTEPKESRNEVSKELSDCPKCEAVPVMPQRKSPCIKKHTQDMHIKSENIIRKT